MKQTLDEFIKTWDGKFCEVAGSANAKNQCVDLVNAYIRDVLELPIIEWTNAVDFPSKAGDKYEYIKNTPLAVPEKGDIIVWTGSVGHIAIVVKADVNRFTSFDQNLPTGSPCKLVDHTYTSPKVLGWLRKKQAPVEPPKPTINYQDWYEQIMLKLNLFKTSKVDEALGHIQSIYNHITEVEKKRDEYKKKAEELANTPPPPRIVEVKKEVVVEPKFTYSYLAQFLYGAAKYYEERARDKSTKTSDTTG